MTDVDVIGSLWVTLGLDSTNFNAGIDKSREEIEKIGQEAAEADKINKDYNRGLSELNKAEAQRQAEAKKSARDLTVLAGAVTAAYAASYKAVQEYGSFAQELKDLSFTTGLTVEEIQHLQYACVISGTDASIMSSAINKLTLSMADAKDPSTEAYAAFMGLGVDPSGRSPKEVFDRTALALVNMEDQTERNSLAMMLYGKSYKDLLPLMETYVERKDEIQKSPAMSQKELDNLDEAKQRWDKLNNSLFIYSGKVLAFIEDLQEKTTNNPLLNPVGYFLGLDTQSETSDYSWKQTTEASSDDTAKMQAKLDQYNAEKEAEKSSGGSLEDIEDISTYDLTLARYNAQQNQYKPITLDDGTVAKAYRDNYGEVTIDIKGNTFYVRDDQDITRIAQQLYDQIKRDNRGRGVS